MATLERQFQEKMREGGLASALRWLNARVAYRYTAVFRFEGAVLRNICLIDKQTLAAQSCPDQPITDSYCVYIRRQSQPFQVENAPLDPRVADHPKRTQFHSYYGIPLYAVDGRLLGTVCHFDPEAIPVSDEAVLTLEALGSLIAAAAFDSR